jgi:ornithine decarboxylase
MNSNAKFTLSKSIVLKQYGIANELADYVSYSSKTNPLVTKILEEKTSSFFSVHLVNELKNIKDKTRVIFLAQAWNNSLIESLISQGITWFVVDNEVDLDMLLNYLKRDNSILSEGKKINLLLRMKLRENSLRTEKYFVFGMTSDIVNNRIGDLKNNPVIDTVGIHFHRKTQNMSEWSLQYELEHALNKDTLDSISVINIGGGLPSIYANTNQRVFDGIFKKIMGLKTWLNSNKIKLMVEPGRFIAAPAGKLHTTILAIHENNIIVNASVYNSNLDALIVGVKLLVLGELVGTQQKLGKAYVVKGITPCSMDLFRYRVYFKDEDVLVGKELVFLNAGAYNFTTEFCNLEKLETEVIE